MDSLCLLKTEQTDGRLCMEEVEGKKKKTSKMIPGILGLETTHMVMPWSAVDKDAGPGVGRNSVSPQCERLIRYPG